MALTGSEMIELAKATGTWDDSNEVDELMEPKDHFEEFSQNSIVFQFWKEVPLLPRKGILEWIYKVKTENIRLKRIQARIKLAEKNL